jgi:predicted acetyltransferase
MKIPSATKVFLIIVLISFSLGCVICLKTFFSNQIKTKKRYKSPEIGYVISKDYWGKGFTTEVAKEIMKFGFEEMDLVRIQARCNVENIG